LRLSESQIIILILLCLCSGLKETLELTLGSYIDPLSIDDIFQSGDGRTDLLLTLGGLGKAQTTLQDCGGSAQLINGFDQLFFCSFEIALLARTYFCSICKLLRFGCIRGAKCSNLITELCKESSVMRLLHLAPRMQPNLRSLQMLQKYVRASKAISKLQKKSWSNPLMSWAEPPQS
jgi:hypothetical protein